MTIRQDPTTQTCRPPMRRGGGRESLGVTPELQRYPTLTDAQRRPDTSSVGPHSPGATR